MCSCVLFVLLLFLEFSSKIVFVVVVLYFLHPSHFTLLSLVARFLLERAVVGILRLAIRLMSRETLASQVSVRGCDSEMWLRVWMRD